jgi:hypothetical protein
MTSKEFEGFSDVAIILGRGGLSEAKKMDPESGGDAMKPDFRGSKPRSQRSLYENTHVFLLS